MDKRVYLKLLLALSTVHNKIRTIEHEIRHLVAFSTKTSSHQLKYQPTKTTSWHQDYIVFFEIMLALFYYFSIIIFFFTLFTPFPIKLFDSGFYFGTIITRGLLVRGKFLKIISIVNIFNELIEKKLIMSKCLIHHECLALSIVAIIRSVGSRLIKVSILLSHITRIVDECAFDLFFMLLLLILTVFHY